MRIYLSATLTDLSEPGGISARIAHGVTPALRQALGDGSEPGGGHPQPGSPEAEEAAEYHAYLLAVEDCLDLLRATGAPPVRVVVAAEVPDAATEGALEPPPASPTSGTASGSMPDPSVVRLSRAVRWDEVQAFFVDEPGARPVVAAALAGDAGTSDPGTTEQSATEQVDDLDLLWFDATERGALAQLGTSSRITP